MKIYSDKLEQNDLLRNVPVGCYLELEDIPKPRVRSRGWTARLLCPSGSRWTNTGTHGAGGEKAATWDQHGEWMEKLFRLDPSARISYYDGREEFKRMTNGKYATTR